jgi:hypothetical protein
LACDRVATAGGVVEGSASLSSRITFFPWGSRPSVDELLPQPAVSADLSGTPSTQRCARRGSSRPCKRSPRRAGVELRRLLGTERHDHARPLLEGLLDSASQAASEVATHHVDDGLAAIAELPALHAVPLCIGRQHFTQTAGPPAIKASHARRTSSISGLSPIAVSLEHPLADGFLLRSFALPAVRLRLQTNEQPRTRAKIVPRGPAFSGDVRPCSLAFAVL